MRKLRLKSDASITFREGCEAYIVSCRQRNLREGTIRHYMQSYTQFYKYFDPDMPLDGFNLSLYDGFILHLRETLDNDVSINSYLRDLKTTLRFLMNEGYVHEFKMRTVKADQQAIETYTDEELSRLLKKPDLKTCSFVQYQSWVMTNFLFSTGVRQHSLINICVNDVDFDNRVVTVRVTKNRKVLIVPLNQTMVGILREFLKHRQHENGEDYLFCNTFGKPLAKSTCYHMLACYNKSCGVETTGIHRYRHTMAKQWILSGGNVVTLSKLLGHSSLAITQNYINLLVSDLADEVEEINLLDKFSGRKAIIIRENPR